MLLELLDNAIYLYFKILNLMEEKKIIEESVVSLKEGLKIAPKIEGTPSGVEGLDE